MTLPTRQDCNACEMFADQEVSQYCDTHSPVELDDNQDWMADMPSYEEVPAVEYGEA